jgi:hypothetical protein
MAHDAWFTVDTVLQLHGLGPQGVTYVNPADDPPELVASQQASA